MSSPEMMEEYEEDQELKYKQDDGDGGGGAVTWSAAINKATAGNPDPEYIIRFIRRVKSYPLLFNQDHEHFRNTVLKQQAWKTIAQEFGQSERWCLRKWVSLRDYFVKRKKRLRLGKPLRPWIYYDELNFLNVMYGEDEQFTDSGDADAESLEASGFSANGDGYLYYPEDAYVDEMEETEPYGYKIENGEGEDEGECLEGFPDVQVELEEEDSSSAEQLGYSYQEQQSVQIQPPAPKTNVVRSTFQQDGKPPVKAFQIVQNGKGNGGIVVNGYNNVNGQSHGRQTQVQLTQYRTATTSTPTSSNSTTSGSILLRNQLLKNPNKPVNTNNSKGSSSSSPISFTVLGKQRNNGLLPNMPQLTPATSSVLKGNPRENGAPIPTASNSNSSQTLQPPPAKRSKSLSSNSRSKSEEEERRVEPPPPPNYSDPYDLFCLSLAAQMRQMSKERAMAYQIEVMNLLYCQEFQPEAEEDPRQMSMRTNKTTNPKFR